MGFVIINLYINIEEKNSPGIWWDPNWILHFATDFLLVHGNLLSLYTWDKSFDDTNITQFYYSIVISIRAVKNPKQELIFLISLQSADKAFFSNWIRELGCLTDAF